MISEEPKSSTLFKFLPILEKIFLCALAIGIILFILKINVLVLCISLIGLAVAFFLSAFRPPAAIKTSEDNPFGFSQMLALVIIPKMLWISSAISVLGIGFYFFAFGNEGYKRTLSIGTLSLTICFILLTVFLISGVKQLKIVAPILLRTVPAFIAGLYFFLK